MSLLGEREGGWGVYTSEERERKEEGVREERGDRLDVCHGISLGEGVGMSLPEDVANSGTRHYLHGTTTHPRPERDL